MAISDIDRRTCTRQVPLRVLALGLGRTGTESLRRALIELGLVDTYHGYAAASENPRDCEMWAEAMRAKFDGIGKPYGRAEFDALLGHCQAVCDLPAACFVDELLLAYPEALVILTNRDVDDWHESSMRTLIAMTFMPGSKIVDFLTWATRSPSRWTRGVFVRALRDYYDGDFEANGKRVYREHYARVRHLCKNRPLLEYRVQDGWDPLCQFLDVGVPGSPFPRGNSHVEAWKRMMAILWRDVRRAAEFALLVSTILVMFWLLWHLMWPDTRLASRRA